MRFHRGLLAAVALVVVTAVGIPTSAAPVHADGGSPIVTAVYTGAGGTGDILYTPDGDLIATDGSIHLTPAAGCNSGGATTVCVGEPVFTGDVEVSQLSGRHFIPGGSSPATALGWIVDEAAQAIRATYGVPFDTRIMTHAMPEIRAYVTTRILDIFDRYAYGHTLTRDEMRTFSFVENWVLETDRFVTRAAHAEYKLWQKEGCGYVPPSAPAFVESPVTLPADVFSWCNRAKNFYSTVFVFAPPQPTPEHFQAWGAYRYVEDVGLGSLESYEAQKLMLETAMVTGVLGGIGVAIGAAVITSALVGSSATAAGAIVSAMGASAASGTAMAAFGSKLVGVMASATASIASASVVAIVVFGIVGTIMATWKFIEYTKVGTTIVERMNEAARATDPFGLDPLRVQGADRPIRGDLDITNLPAYRKESNVLQLAHLVTRWMAITPDGHVIPDEKPIWSDNATTTRDYTFQLTDASGTRAVDAIRVPDLDGSYQEVRFSRSWMIVTPDGEQPRAALSFRYRDDEGVHTTATRSIAPMGGWVLTRPATTGPGFWGTQHLAISYLDENGDVATAEILPPQKKLGGPHPTAVGPLVPGRMVMLRPNPIAEDGSFELARYQSDFAYEWAVDRYDEVAEAWVPVAVEDANAYGTRFTPTEIGQYRAFVTMTDLLDPDADQAWGVVQFRVGAPEIDALTLELHDDGDTGLDLRMRFSEPVATDDLDVVIEWPQRFGEESRETAEFDLPCVTLGIDCETTASFHSRTHTLSEDSDLSSGVKVTVTNSYGSVLTRTFELDHPARPVLEAPYVDPTPPQPGSVGMGPGTLSAQLVAETGTDSNYMLATVVPGDSATPVDFGFRRPGGQTPRTIDVLGTANVFLTVSYDDDAGLWSIGLWGEPELSDVGSYELPVALGQTSGATTPFLLRLEIVASPDDRYRGVLSNTIASTGLAQASLPDLQPQIIGGHTEWEAFDGEVCVTFGIGGMTDTLESCGPVEDFFDENGAPLPFPYRELLPTGVPSGAATATITIDGDDPDGHIFAGEHEVWFSLTSGPPKITNLSWNASKGVAKLAVQRSAQNNAITKVTCELDDATVPCWGTAGGDWRPSGLTVGDHSLTVWVDDAAGNYTSQTLAFTVKPKSSTPGPVTDAPRPPIRPDVRPIDGGDVTDDADGDDVGVGDGDDSGDPAAEPEPQPQPGDEDGDDGVEAPVASGDAEPLPVGVWIAVVMVLAIGLAVGGFLLVRRRAF